MSVGPENTIDLPDPIPFEIEVTETDITSTASLTLTQPVYTFGTIELGRRGASLALEGARMQLARAEETVRRDVEEAFLQAALAAALRSVSEQSVATAEERLRLAEARFDAGTVARFEVLRSEVSLATSREELLQAETAAELALSALAQKLGLPAQAELNISPPDPATVEPVAPDFTLVEAQETALANRRDLRALELATELGDVAVQLTRNRPSLVFQGNYSISDRATGFSEKENWSLVLNLAYDLFDGGRSRAQEDQASARRDALAAQLEEARSMVELEVEAAYRSLVESLDRIEVARRTLASAKEALRIAELGYSEGVIAYIDYQDADLGLRQAETLHLQAVYGYLIAESGLHAALGFIQE